MYSCIMVFITHLGSLSAGIPGQSGDSELSLEEETKMMYYHGVNGDSARPCSQSTTNKKVAPLSAMWVNDQERDIILLEGINPNWVFIAAHFSQGSAAFAISQKSDATTLRYLETKSLFFIVTISSHYKNQDKGLADISTVAPAFIHILHYVQGATISSISSLRQVPVF